MSRTLKRTNFIRFVWIVKMKEFAAGSCFEFPSHQAKSFPGKSRSAFRQGKRGTMPKKARIQI